MTTLDLLRQHLAQRAAIDPERIQPEVRLEDIGVDSLILIDLMFDLEEKLNVRVPDLRTTPTTVAELITLFDQLAATAPAAEANHRFGT